jgi:hypothetical protein
VGDVRTLTQIDQRTTAIDSGGSTIGDLVVDDMDLVRVMLEHFQEVCLGHFKSHKRLLFLVDHADELFKTGVIVL